MVTDRLCRCANKNPWERERWTELNPFVPFKEFFPMAIYLFSGNGVLANSRLHYLAQRIIGVTIATKNVPLLLTRFFTGQHKKEMANYFRASGRTQNARILLFCVPFVGKERKREWRRRELSFTTTATN